ncbi:MAG: GNAT family N-acetyltransferase [candidate division Zixibacteria bacterium]|nr:GNAT family N-acetyltransferase [candidate division Zixibacteria bacterium]
MIKIILVKTNKQIALARPLLEEYARSLGFHLDFQDFQTELNNLPGDYALPDGRMLLAYSDDTLAGCVGMRKFDQGVCELKRMYVKPEFRKQGIGRQLAEAVIARARDTGYKLMRLDTLANMTEAVNLYRSLGFKESERYRYNPIEGAKFFGLEL